MVAHLTKQFIRLHVTPRAKPYEIYDTLVKGLLLRVQPTGTQVYYVTYVNATGKRKRIKIAHASQISPQQARDRAKQLLASVICGDDPAFQKKMSKRSYRLDVFIDSIYRPWLESSRKRGREEALRLKSSFKLLLSLELSQITAWHIERWRKQRKQQGTSLSTMNRDFASLNALLNRAVEWEFLAENPLLGKVKRYKIDNQRIRF